MAASAPEKTLLCLGEFTRALHTVYEQYLLLSEEDDQDSIVTAADTFIDSLFNVGVATTFSCFKQIASEYKRQEMDQNDKEMDHHHRLTWGEFCVVAAELFAHAKIDDKRCLPVGRVYLNCEETTDNNSTNVFLGGSCNPTVWRKETAVPLLEREGVSYYNPQVDKWHPQLIDIEEQAKQNASVLLFVVDSQTRAISSMVESGLLIGAGRRIVVVLKDIVMPLAIDGERLSNKEVIDLNCGRKFLTELSKLHSVIVESSIEEGTKLAIDIMKHRMTSEVLARNLSRHDVKLENTVSSQLRLIRLVLELYMANAHNRQSATEVVPTLKRLVTEDLSNPLLSSIASVLLISCNDDNSSSLFKLSSLSSINVCSNRTMNHISTANTPSSTINLPPSSASPLNPCSSVPSSITLAPSSASPLNPCSSVPSTANTPSTITLPLSSASPLNPCSPVPSTASVSANIIGSTDLLVDSFKNSFNSANILCNSFQDYFERFCVCYSELRYLSTVQMQKEQGTSSQEDWLMSLSNIVLNPLQWIKERVIPLAAAYNPLITSVTMPMETKIVCDVFLGGSQDNSQWPAVIPLLRREGLTVFSRSQVPPVSDCKDDSIMFLLESNIASSCKVLLYVITGQCLSVSPLIEASYYIGLGKPVVLCIEDILVNETGSTIIDGVQLNKVSVKDYNRGRSYLRNLAKKRHVPVYSCISDAIACCVHTLRGCHRRFEGEEKENPTATNYDSKDTSSNKNSASPRPPPSHDSETNIHHQTRRGIKRSRSSSSE